MTFFLGLLLLIDTQTQKLEQVIKKKRHTHTKKHASNETIMTRTEASIRRTNAQSGIQFRLNYVHRSDKDIERV